MAAEDLGGDDKGPIKRARQEPPAASESPPVAISASPSDDAEVLDVKPAEDSKQLDKEERRREKKLRKEQREKDRGEKKRPSCERSDSEGQKKRKLAKEDEKPSDGKDAKVAQTPVAAKITSVFHGFKPVQVTRKISEKERADAAAKAAKIVEDSFEVVSKGKEKEKETEKEKEKGKEKDKEKDKEHKKEKKSKESKEGKSKGNKDSKDRPLVLVAREDIKDVKAKEEAPVAKAKGIEALGNLDQLRKEIADQRMKLRLWIIKAKQEWEEKETEKGARGETNDQEYYMASAGEIFGPSKEYRAEGSIGKGVFSTVFRCKHVRQNADYAVKFVRSNVMMKKAAEKEVETYRRLAKLAPKEDLEASQFIMFLAPPETFIHQGHMCLVFDLLKCDLRTALSKYGQGRGLPLQTVAQYGRQIFLALRVLRKLKCIHGDLKPDNLLMTLSKTEVKLCDFGSAMDVAEEVKTAYLQPRYYRAPEVILGSSYDTQVDLWSAGVTLYELASGKILFTGRSNNAMLRQMMEISGAFSKRMATTGSFSAKHFDSEGNFLQQDLDSITGKPQVFAMSKFEKPRQSISGMLERVLKEPPPNSDQKTQERLLPRVADLVCKLLRLDPGERFTPEHALDHPFFKKDK